MFAWSADASAQGYDLVVFYQMRVTSWREPGGTRCEISQTEDLKGIFFTP